MTMHKAILSLVLVVLATACGSAKFAGKNKKEKEKSADVTPVNPCALNASGTCMPKDRCEQIVKAGESCACENNICTIIKDDPKDNPGQNGDDPNQNGDDANQSDADANQSDDPNQGDPCDDPNQSK